MFSRHPTVSAPSLCLLFLGAPQSRLYATPHLRVQQGAHEDHGCAHPVPGSEGVLEVKDGEDEAEELSECHHQGDGQWSALCRQDEHPADAHIPAETVKVCNKTQRKIISRGQIKQAALKNQSELLEAITGFVSLYRHQINQYLELQSVAAQFYFTYK